MKTIKNSRGNPYRTKRGFLEISIVDGRLLYSCKKRRAMKNPASVFEVLCPAKLKNELFWYIMRNPNDWDDTFKLFDSVMSFIESHYLLVRRIK